MDWFYKNKDIKSHADLPDNCTHFVYELSYDDDTKYIGYKTVRSIRRLKPTKKQLAIRKNYVRKEMKDLPFVNYEGSSDENKDKILISKEILYLSSNKRTATYLEAKLLFCNSVLEDDRYNNKQINKNWWDNCLDGLIKENNE